MNQQLSTLIRQGRVRSAIDSMPPVTMGKFHELPHEYLTRASCILSSLAHAYFFGLGEDERHRLQLPTHIDDAWSTVCQRLGRPFTGRVIADDILNNVITDQELNSFQLSIPIFDTPEERLTSGLQGFMEAEFAPALTIMSDAHSHVLANDEEAVAECLEQLSAVIICCAKIFKEITPHANTDSAFDPIIWVKSYPAMGNPIRKEELGNSGADSPLFHALDSFLGREPQEGDLREMQMERRETLPRIIREFLKALEDPSVSIRRFVEGSVSTRLQSTFDATVQLYLWFLERHRVKAVGITGVSLASGRHKTSSGVKSSGPGAHKTINPPGLGPVQMLNQQMKLGMLSRLGKRDPWQVATIKKTSRGSHCDSILIEFRAAMPIQPGDHVQVFPTHDDDEVKEAVSALKARFGTSGDFPDREDLSRRDLSNVDKLLFQPENTNLKEFVDKLPVHKPRFYSISETDPNGKGLSKTALLTVGHGNRPYGLSTRYLRSRQREDKLRVSLWPCPKFNLPSDPRVPLILVGQGSGIGPLIGFVHARARLSKNEHSIGRIIMIIGARRLDSINRLDEMILWTRLLPLTIKLALTDGENVTIVEERFEIHRGCSNRVTKVIQQEFATIQCMMKDGGHIFVW
jgi:hypothetical protein